MHAAPEVMDSISQTYCGKKADIWSCGVLLYVLLFCRYPFAGPEDPSTREGRAEVLTSRAWSVAVREAPAPCLPAACWRDGVLNAQAELLLHTTQILQRTLEANFELPTSPAVSPECCDLLRNMIVKAWPCCISAEASAACGAASQLSCWCLMASGLTRLTCSQDPAQRFGTAEVMSHPWFLVGLPPGWDRLNSVCLQNKVGVAGSGQAWAAAKLMRRHIDCLRRLIRSSELGQCRVSLPILHLPSSGCSEQPPGSLQACVSACTDTSALPGLRWGAGSLAGTAPHLKPGTMPAPWKHHRRRTGHRWAVPK